VEDFVPTYQYACTACGEQLEAVQAFTDAPLTECPACGGRLRKVFSAVGVVFKGSGFYRTDSRSPAGAAKPGDGGGSGGEGGGGKDGGTQAGGGKEGAGKEGAGKEGAGSPAKTESAPAAKSGSSSSAAVAKSA
jgi:putative FmdB family regulatory protein